MSHMREPDFSQPDMKEAMKSVLKYEIQTLIERLSEYGVESVLITASVDQGSHGHIASQKGDKFTKFKNVADLEQQFLCFCTGASLYDHGKTDMLANKNLRMDSHGEITPVHERRSMHSEPCFFPREDLRMKRHKGSQDFTPVQRRSEQLTLSSVLTDGYNSQSNLLCTPSEQIVIDPVTNTMYKQANPDRIKSEPYDPDLDNSPVHVSESKTSSSLQLCGHENYSSEENCPSITVLDLEALSGPNSYMDLEGPLPGSVLDGSIIKDGSSSRLSASRHINQSCGNQNIFQLRPQGPNVSLQTPAKFQCSTCPSSFTDKKSLQQHKMKEHEERGSHCLSNQSLSDREESKINTINEQDTHMKETHKHEVSIRDLQEQNQGHFSCPFSECRERFESEFLLQEHMTGHSNCLLYACPQCNKTFDNRFSMTKHMQICGQRFTCRICGKVYSTKGSLWHHQQVHKVGRYRCNCGLTYAYRTGLARHRTMTKH
ncbi:hypothetical protein CHS0354_037188 [Potamilus streckersoni]|uniref:C2H2-type domain-containing protein n=1 Tax=Potamilus streckersoni TaxID=2493646 RepID=A0AAE0W341_9BIVA|nr:hypothetical protein CHS0354_037188 [Potamilus streckersoni]